MKKLLKNLKNVQLVSKDQQKNILGGRAPICRNGTVACMNDDRTWSCLRNCPC